MGICIIRIKLYRLFILLQGLIQKPLPIVSKPQIIMGLWLLWVCFYGPLVLTFCLLYESPFCVGKAQGIEGLWIVWPELQGLLALSYCLFMFSLQVKDYGQFLIGLCQTGIHPHGLVIFVYGFIQVS